MRKLIFIGMLVFLSCKKDAGTRISANALVVNTGDASQLGCGWLLFVGDSAVSYHPDNLNDDFKEDGIKVTVKYRLTNDKFTCGDFMLQHLPVIHIVEIKRQ